MLLLFFGAFILFSFFTVTESAEQLTGVYLFEFPERIATLGCFLESATTHLKDINVTILAKASKPDVEDNLRTWLKKSSFSDVNLKFVDPKSMFESEGLGDLYQRITSKDRYVMIMLSDVLRVVHIYQNGGIYADLDQVFLKPIDFSQYQSFLSNSPVWKNINNNIFKFPKGSAVLKELLENFKHNDVSYREALGPSLYTRLFRVREKDIIRDFEMTSSAFHYLHDSINSKPAVRKFFNENIDKACPKFSSQLRTFYSIHKSE